MVFTAFGISNNMKKLSLGILLGVCVTFVMAQSYNPNFLTSITSVQVVAALPTVQTNTVTMTLTNFVSGQIYTNTTGRLIHVRAAVQITPAAIVGNASMNLKSASQGVTLTTISGAGLATLITSLINIQTNELSGWVTNGGVFSFTNGSSGAGNNSAIIAGTGQLTQF